jgi:hypothetical protein
MSGDLEQMEERAVSLPSYMVAEIDEAAQANGITFSTWLTEAVALRLWQETERTAIAMWQREAGPLTDAQIAAGLARARAAFGISSLAP